MGIRVPPPPPRNEAEMRQQIADLERNIMHTARFHAAFWITTVILLLLGALAAFAGDPTPVVRSGLALPLSQRSVEFIQEQETGGKAYYSKRLTGVAWPGGASVGVGFDCGYNTRAQIQAAWASVCSPAELNALLACAGATGARGQALARRYRSAVRITWEEAQVPFVRDTLPRFTQQTASAFRLTPTQLHPHSNGALTSLVFNRGPSMTGHSRRHMVSIRDALGTGRPEKVPQIFLDMRVLWQGKGLDGLLTRRRLEADLFSQGLLLKKQYP
jgi:GH24 family phage-related lysozyme (muramidase)